MAKTTVRSGQVRNIDLQVEDLKDFGVVDAGGLNITVTAGRIRSGNTVTDKNNQAIALTDNATNFVEITTVGVASANTSAFTSGSIPIAQVVTASADISSIADKRAWVNSDAGGGSVIRYLQIRVTDSQANNAIATTIGGDVESPITGTINEVVAYLDTAGTTGTQTIDINKNGTTILSTKITIDTTEKSSRTAATPSVLSVTSVTVGDIFTIDVDGVHTTVAKGLTVIIKITE